MQIQVLDSKFLTSSSSIKNAPPLDVTEIAILGRSNVGKSSFINSLLNKKLAKSSSTPGKTRLINFFEAYFNFKDEMLNNQSIRIKIIDLPGFGYAKVDKKTKKQWDINLSEFLQTRSSIKLFCHLIDSRHKDLQIDKDINAFLESFKKNDSKILKIFTKSDKLSKNDLANLRKNNALYISNTIKDSTCMQNILKSMLSYSILGEDFKWENNPKKSINGI